MSTLDDMLWRSCYLTRPLLGFPVGKAFATRKLSKRLDLFLVYIGPLLDARKETLFLVRMNSDPTLTFIKVNEPAPYSDRDQHTIESNVKNMIGSNVLFGARSLTLCTFPTELLEIPFSSEGEGRGEDQLYRIDSDNWFELELEQSFGEGSGFYANGKIYIKQDSKSQTANHIDHFLYKVVSLDFPVACKVRMDTLKKYLPKRNMVTRVPMETQLALEFRLENFGKEIADISDIL